VPGTEDLDGSELSPSDVLSCTHYPLQSLALECQEIDIPGGDAASQDALSGVAVELFEDLRVFSTSDWKCP
jgi:hypothetical protein